MKSRPQAGRSMQDALAEAARESQTIAFLMPAPASPRPLKTRRSRRAAERAQQIEEQIAASREEVRRMAEEKSGGEVPEKTPEKTPEEPGNLSGDEQSDGPVKD